jgi:hypothetical protein
MNFFDVYIEPLWLFETMSVLNLLSYFLIFAVPCIIFEVVLYHQDGKKWYGASVGLAVLLTYLNARFHVFESLWWVVGVYAIISYLTYINTNRKSIKWINLSFLWFMLFITLMYAYFNDQVHNIINYFFFVNDVIIAHVQYKPFLSLGYTKPEWDAMNTLSFVWYGENIHLPPNPLTIRVYLFYYALHVIGLGFWLIVYGNVLKKHILKQAHLKL